MEFLKIQTGTSRWDPVENEPEKNTESAGSAPESAAAEHQDGDSFTEATDPALKAPPRRSDLSF